MFVIVVGGGKVGFYLTKELVEGHELVLMEKDGRARTRSPTSSGRSSSTATAARAATSRRPAPTGPPSSRRSPATTTTTSSSARWPSITSTSRARSPGSTTRATRRSSAISAWTRSSARRGWRSPPSSRTSPSTSCSISRSSKAASSSSSRPRSPSDSPAHRAAPDGHPAARWLHALRAHPRRPRARHPSRDDLPGGRQGHRHLQRPSARPSCIGSSSARRPARRRLRPAPERRPGSIAVGASLDSAGRPSDGLMARVPIDASLVVRRTSRWQQTVSMQWSLISGVRSTLRLAQRSLTTLRLDHRRATTAPDTGRDPDADASVASRSSGCRHDRSEHHLSDIARSATPFDRLFDEGSFRPLAWSGYDRHLPLDVRSTEEADHDRGRAPGRAPEDIAITVHQDTLTIAVARRDGARAVRGRASSTVRSAAAAAAARSTLPSGLDARRGRGLVRERHAAPYDPAAEQAKPRQIAITPDHRGDRSRVTATAESAPQASRGRPARPSRDPGHRGARAFGAGPQPAGLRHQRGRRAGQRPSPDLAHLRG